MPEQPQEHTPDLYAVLVDVRHALANATQLAGYALDLKASADRLLPLVGDELRKARRAIDQALTILPIVIGVLVLPACAVEPPRLRRVFRLRQQTRQVRQQGQIRLHN